MAMMVYKEYLSYFSEWERYSFLRSDNFLKRLKCGSPSHLKNKYLYQLNETELQCDSRCTNNEKCICTETPYNRTLRIICTKIQVKHMPSINQYSSKLQIHLGYNDIYKFPMGDNTISVQVILLDLSYNYITNIPIIFFSHYPNIIHLNLAGNRLTAIPSISEWKNINSLKSLQFRKNNFTCNCSGLLLKETLTSLNAKATVDLTEIKCSSPSLVKGKVLYNLSDDFFACFYMNWVLILSLTLSLLLCLLVTMFIAYIFRYYIVHTFWMEILLFLHNR